jgi:hypothetical protein
LLKKRVGALIILHFYMSELVRLLLGSLCKKSCNKRMVQSNSTFILLEACARTVTSLALHRSTTPLTSRSSPRNARQCCIIPARRAEQRRAELWRLAGLIRDTFMGSPKTRCCLLPAWVLLGPHDKHELQPHAREQGCFPWQFGGKTWCLARSGWRSRAFLRLWLSYYNTDTI